MAERRAPSGEFESEDRSLGRFLAGLTIGATVTRRPFAYATSHRLEEIDLTGSGSTVPRLVVKYLGRDGLTDAATRAKPASGHCAQREIFVYRDVLLASDLGTPAFVGASFDNGRARGFLAMERLVGTPLTEIGDFGVWETAARWLARMHTRFCPISDQAWACSPLLVRYGRDRLSADARRGLETAALGGLAPPAVLEAIAAAHEGAVDRLAAIAPTLLHGDFYPSNIIVTNDLSGPSSSRVGVVDWELTGIGPGVLDLAALVAGGWTAVERHILAAAYHEELARAGPVVPLPVLVELLDLASLHLALHWTGWTSEWVPPAEHRRDWFAEVIAALERLEDGAR